MDSEPDTSYYQAKYARDSERVRLELVRENHGNVEIIEVPKSSLSPSSSFAPRAHSGLSGPVFPHG